VDAHENIANEILKSGAVQSPQAQFEIAPKVSAFLPRQLRHNLTLGKPNGTLAPETVAGRLASREAPSSTKHKIVREGALPFAVKKIEESMRRNRNKGRFPRLEPSGTGLSTDMDASVKASSGRQPASTVPLENRSFFFVE
jgi:hypothetical protein